MIDAVLEGSEKWHVEVGDVLDVLRTMPADSVHTVVTSPPYWGLRDYGLPASVWGGDPDCAHEWGATERGKRKDLKPEGETALVSRTGTHENQGRAAVNGGNFCQRCGAWRGCLGLEPTPDMFVAHMTEVFREVRRVLHPEGVAWVNMGDTFNGTGGEGGDYRANGSGLKAGRAGSGPRPNRIDGMKPKDLVGVPWMLAFALRSDGWYLRRDVVWHKPNPMPESAMDRPHSSHEYMFLLTKSPRYFYDAEAVREPASVNTHARRKDGGASPKQAMQPDRSGGVRANASFIEATSAHSPKRHLRSVWTIKPEAFPEAHFAVYPPALVEPCVLAGSSKRGACPTCGRQWERVVEVEQLKASGSGGSGNMPEGKNGHKLQGGGDTGDVRFGPVTITRTLGWKRACDHEVEPIPPVILDPFSGSGTTGVVALRLGRHYVGIELSEEYAEISRKRLKGALLPRPKRSRPEDRPGQASLL